MEPVTEFIDCFGYADPGNIYTNFGTCVEKNKCNDASRQIKTEMESILSNHGIPENSRNGILDTWCSIRTIKKGSEPKGFDCSFLYYWLGSIVSSTVQNHQEFMSIMGEIYRKVKEVSNVRDCGNPWPNITKEQFENLDKLYKHTKSCEYMKSKIEQHGKNGICFSQYKELLEGVVRVYNKMKKHCACNNEDDYCKEFKRVFTDGEISKLKELMQKLSMTSQIPKETVKTCIPAEIPKTLSLPEPEQQREQQQELENEASVESTSKKETPTDNTPAIAIASAGLAFVGFPTVLFLAYKV
ncbi:KIR-like protein [Plasmodium coatneyi]|uniref:KIR-like protein n=1 Tax=Plasmodium coatneyi TaxID=208452 RepID=A0A1B1DWE9_9APIC|nr:KIR-like protein [Plasmodium coatneyi]ANQ07116.1 KIR-like protein [Plasmodium coatneyi]